MRLIMVFALLLTAHSLAEGVVRSAVTTRDVLDLFDQAVAVEIEIPDDATTFHLIYGRGGISAFLDQHPMQGPPNVLRVVAFLPDPGEVDPCAAGEAQATVIATPISAAGRGGRHLQRVCVPHPEKTRITGVLREVIEGSAPELDEWMPLLFHAWLVREGSNAPGAVDSAVALDSHFTMQVKFGSRNSTAFDSEDALRLDEFIDLPVLRRSIERFGIARE
ncbi:MAG TPA: hypothetical protein VF168_08630 [Trueperaceae bacterium]